MPPLIHRGIARPWTHGFAFDPTSGYDLERLLTVRPPLDEPGDFDAFWRGTFVDNQAIPLRYSLRRVPSPQAGMRAFLVRYDSWGGHQAGAWLVEPEHGEPRLGAVIGHGYGGRDDITPGPWCLNRPQDADVVRIFPVARGFHISAMEGVPINSARHHVVQGIDSRESYILRACVAELWTAARILCDRHPSVRERLAYVGGSFGGGLGALMLPWCPWFRTAYLNLPTFGHHPLRLRLPCTGSGASVRDRYRSEPGVAEVLRYYDAASAARRIRIPVFVGAARFDPGVPPPGQFAIANALSSQSRLFVASVGHISIPEVAEEGPLAEMLADRFLREALGLP